MSDAIARRKFLEAPISDNSFPPLVNQCANMASFQSLLSPRTIIDDIKEYIKRAR